MGASPLEWACFAATLSIPVGAVWYLIRWLKDESRRDPDLCESCGYDLRESPGRCPECGTISQTRASYARLARIREAWPAEELVPRVPEPGEELVEAYMTDSDMVAELLRDHLEARGIACDIRLPEPIGRAGGAVVYGSYKLMVWSGDAERAGRIVDSLMADDPE